MALSKPQRSCIACRTKGDQTSFWRISARTLSFIANGPSDGRSAYICPQAACLDAALSKGRLSRALRQALDNDHLERLRRDLACKLQ